MGTLLNVSLPFFGLIFIGYAAGWTRIITAQAYLGLNAFVIWFALPAMLFIKMARRRSSRPSTGNSLPPIAAAA